MSASTISIPARLGYFFEKLASQSSPSCGPLPSLLSTPAPVLYALGFGATFGRGPVRLVAAGAKEGGAEYAACPVKLATAGFGIGFPMVGVEFATGFRATGGRAPSVNFP